MDTRTKWVVGVVGAAVIFEVLHGHSSPSGGSGGSGGLPSGVSMTSVCNTVISDLAPASTYVSEGDGNDLTNSAETATVNEQGDNATGSQLDNDLLTLENDSMAWENGGVSTTQYVTADLKKVYADCGQTYNG